MIEQFGVLPVWLSSLLEVIVGVAAVFITAGQIGRCITRNYKEAALSAQALVEALKTRITSLEETNRDILREQGALKKENEFLRNRNGELQQELEELRSENQILRDRVGKVENGNKKGGKR